MATISPIGSEDGRYETLVKGFNLRFPTDKSQQAQGIYICSTEEDVKDALTDAIGKLPLSAQDPKVATGKRITVKSGGNCYEGFVSNNPSGYIIDIGLVAGLSANVTVSYSDGGLLKRAGQTGAGGDNPHYNYKALPGTQNWNAAVQLFKLTGKAVPGGCCYSVALGGHFSGGGYGFLSRLHGLTVDWLAAVDVLVVRGTASKPEVQWLHASPKVNSDLFKFCCGGGGGSIGIITAFYFNELPPAPKEVALMFLDIDWSEFTGNQAKFNAFMNRYARYMHSHSVPEKNASWGLFTFLKVTHFSAKKLQIVLQYCSKNGDLSDCAPLFEFLGYR
jgi:FAD/FMN-containing dehydrogenase